MTGPRVGRSLPGKPHGGLRGRGGGTGPTRISTWRRCVAELLLKAQRERDGRDVRLVDLDALIAGSLVEGDSLGLTVAGLEDEPLRASGAGQGLRFRHDSPADTPAASLVVNDEPFDLPFTPWVAQSHVRQRCAVRLNSQQSRQD